MIKKSIFVVTIGVLAIGVSAFAMNKTDRGIRQENNNTGGKITNIKGNVVTIKDSKGVERVFEVSSVKDLKVGAPAWCEEDCGKQLKLGDKVVNVQKVIKR